MPMIRGRYYMNPTMGAAIENTRALGNASQLGEGPSDPFTDEGASDSFGQETGDSPATAIPVSYTHLDVYKRQALHAAVNQKSLRFSHLTNAQHSCRNLVCKLDFCSKRLP